jgi:hypothetical protein
VCYAFPFDPKHRKQKPGGFHHFQSSRGNHRNALEMSKTLVLLAMVVVDAASRHTGLGAEPSEFRQLVMMPALQGEQPSQITIKGLPYPAFLPFLLHVVAIDTKMLQAIAFCVGNSHRDEVQI